MSIIHSPFCNILNFISEEFTNNLPHKKGKMASAFLHPSPNQVTQPAEDRLQASSMEVPAALSQQNDSISISWLVETTKRKVKQARSGTNRCKACGWRASQTKIRVHATQHYFRYFCICGFSSVSEDEVSRHRGEACSKQGAVAYKVDRESYPAWKAAVGLDSTSPYRRCKPINATRLPVSSKPAQRKTSKHDQLKNSLRAMTENLKKRVREMQRETDRIINRLPEEAMENLLQSID